MSINEKLLKLQEEIGPIEKDTTNPFFKSKYFDINALVDTVKPILSEHGILLTQPIIDGVVKTILEDVESGETRESGIELPKDVKPQDVGSAITYYRRYTLQSLLALQAEDDDANRASGKSSRKSKPKPKKSKAKPKEEPREEPVEDNISDKINKFTEPSDLVDWFNDEVDKRDDPDEREKFNEKYLDLVRDKAAELY